MLHNKYQKVNSKWVKSLFFYTHFNFLFSLRFYNLIEEADKAVYHAKNHVHNQVILYSSALTETKTPD